MRVCVRCVSARRCVFRARASDVFFHCHSCCAFFSSLAARMSPLPLLRAATHTHTHTHTHSPRGCTRNGSVAEANHAQFTHRMKRKRKKKAETARQEREKEKDTRLHACVAAAKSAVVQKARWCRKTKKEKKKRRAWCCLCRTKGKAATSFTCSW